MLAFQDQRLTLPAGASGERRQVVVGVASMHKRPDSNATQVSQVLFGEQVTVHHEDGAFVLVQGDLDQYVGWVARDHLSASVLVPTHRVNVARLHAYADPQVTAAPSIAIGRGAKLVDTGERSGRYIRFERAGWIAEHLVALVASHDTDPAAVATQFMGTPYLWGGRSSLGIDCSGLVQQAFAACGVTCPRDSDMQRHWFGDEIEHWDRAGALRRGDLIFWKGHVGILLDAETLLHANGTFMVTMQEPLAPAIKRIAKEYGEPLGARRIDISKSVGEVPAWFTALV